VWVGIKTGKNKNARPFRLLDLSSLYFSIIWEGGERRSIRVICAVRITLPLLRGEQKRQNPTREVLGNHCGQSQQGRLELGLRVSTGW